MFTLPATEINLHSRHTSRTYIKACQKREILELALEFSKVDVDLSPVSLLCLEGNRVIFSLQWSGD
jgi:hypothetical protein